MSRVGSTVPTGRVTLPQGWSDHLRCSVWLKKCFWCCDFDAVHFCLRRGLENCAVSQLLFLFASVSLLGKWGVGE